MSSAELRFEVAEAVKDNFSFKTYFRDMFRPKFGGGFKPYSSGRGPSVLAKNSAGEAYVIEVTKTIEEARQRAATIQGDYRMLSTQEWCSKYDVPASFVAGG